MHKVLQDAQYFQMNSIQYMSITWWKDESNCQNNVMEEEIKKLILFFSFYNSLCTYVWKWEWNNYKEE